MPMGELTTTAAKSMGLMDWLLAGGWLMLPMVLCSVLAIAIILERIQMLKLSRVAPAGVVDRALAIAHGKLPESQLNQLATDSPLGHILAVGVQQRHQPPEQVALQMQAAASVQLHHLERYLSVLGTIAYIAPLLGLLGTVIGIIQAFMAVQTGGVTDPAMLTSGLAKALVTTAAGMLVAIPAMIGLRALQRQVASLMVTMEWQASRLLQGLQEQNLALQATNSPAASPGQLTGASAVISRGR